MQDQKNETPESGGEYIRPLRRRWWLIAVIALVAAAGTYRYYSDKPVVYQSSTSLYMQPSSNAVSGGGGNTDPNFLANQAILLKTPAVAAVAAKNLGYHGNPSDLLGTISATPQSGTDFLNVTATASTPLLSAQLANAFARAYISTEQSANQSSISQALKAQERRLASTPQDNAHADQRDQIASLITQLELLQSVPAGTAKQVEPAAMGAPTSSSPTSHAIYGLILGLVIGIGLAYVLDALDRRIKVVSDVEPAYGSPVLVTVPSAPRRVCSADPRLGLQPPLAESFRSLRTTIQLGSGSTTLTRVPAGRAKTIMVASAVPSEGKSTVVRNLALAHLEAGQRVVVVDCDLRRPDLSKSFRVEATPGLPEVLTNKASVWDALQTIAVEDETLGTIARLRQIGQTRPLADSENDELMFLAVGDRGGSVALPKLGQDSEEPGRGPELALLPASAPSWNPAAVFGTGRFDSVLAELQTEFEVVLLDTPPLTAVSDAGPLLSLADTVVLVSRVGRTPVQSVREMKAVIGRVPTANVIGVVANDVRERAGAYGYSQPYGARA